MNVVPQGEANEVQIGGLYDSLHAVILQHCQTETLTMAEIVGTIEIVKSEIITDYE